MRTEKLQAGALVVSLTDAELMGRYDNNLRWERLLQAVENFEWYLEKGPGGEEPERFDGFVT